MVTLPRSYQAFSPWRPLPAAAARAPFDVLQDTALPGLDPAWSRLVEAKVDDGARTFHVLDTGRRLAQLGIKPVGTILAVHGNPTWSYLWRGVLQASIAQAEAGGPAWRVIAPDQLDMGFSERLAHDEPPSSTASSYRRLHERLGDLDGLMDALDVNTDLPLVTLGHDWGGMISLAWAVHQHAAVDAVMTLNTAVHHPEGEPVPSALRTAMAPGVLPTGTVRTDAFLKVTLSLAEQSLDDSVRAAYRAPYVSRLGRGGIGGFVADIPATSQHQSRPALERAADALSQWEKPALLLWGPEDPVFQDRYLADLRQRLPHADLHRFEKAGHLLAEDRDISSVIFTWLSDRFGHSGQDTGATRQEDAVAPAPAAEVTGLHEQMESMRLSWRADSPAVVDMTAADPATLSWQELSSRVESLAAGLHELGVRAGDRVSLLVQPGNSLTVILYACLRLGAVGVVADAGLGLRGMTRAVRSARPDWVIGELPGLSVARAFSWPGQRISVDALSPRQAKLFGTVASVERLQRHSASSSAADVLADVPAPEGHAPAAVLFTSGSTGPAKGVVYTHQRLGALVALLRKQFSVKPGSSLIAGFAPFALLGPAIGATSVTPDMSVTKPATLTATAVADAAASGEATMFFGSPAALRNVVATAGDLSADQQQALKRIRLVLSAGAPVHPEILDAVHRLFPQAEVHTPYGMTEGLLQADIERADVHQAMATGQPGVCVGQAVDGVRFALAPLDATGNSAEELVDPQDADGALGEIVVTAAHLKARYDNLWYTDRLSRRDTLDGLIWHRTGDVGHIDRDGRLWVQGRLQHVITTPDGPVGPGVIETPVDALHEVARSAAVGIGPTGTQTVAVVVEPAPFTKARVGSSPLATPELAETVRRASADVPVSAVLVMDELPTDIRHNSKIERTALAHWAEDVLAGRKGAGL